MDHHLYTKVCIEIISVINNKSTRSFRQPA